MIFWHLERWKHVMSLLGSCQNHCLNPDWLRSSCDVIWLLNWGLRGNAGRNLKRHVWLQQRQACVRVCVCSGTYRCWPCLWAEAGRTQVSSCATGMLGCSAHSPAHWCCAHTHTAALHHATHTEMRAGYIYTCGRHKPKVHWLNLERTIGTERRSLDTCSIWSLPDDPNLCWIYLDVAGC